MRKLTRAFRPCVIEPQAPVPGLCSSSMCTSERDAEPRRLLSAMTYKSNVTHGLGGIAWSQVRWLPFGPHLDGARIQAVRTSFTSGGAHWVRSIRTALSQGRSTREAPSRPHEPKRSGDLNKLPNPVSTKDGQDGGVIVWSLSTQCHCTLYRIRAAAGVELELPGHRPSGLMHPPITNGPLMCIRRLSSSRRAMPARRRASSRSSSRSSPCTIGKGRVCCRRVLLTAAVAMAVGWSGAAIVPASAARPAAVITSVSTTAQSTTAIAEGSRPRRQPQPNSLRLLAHLPAGSGLPLGSSRSDSARPGTSPTTTTVAGIRPRTKNWL
jgi:hypothetical protein